MSPRLRRTLFIALLVLSGVLWLGCRVAYALGKITPETLDQITNDLSWFAILLTCMDVVLTADVRVQEDEKDD